jgi:hypothetical protein
MIVQCCFNKLSEIEDMSVLNHVRKNVHLSEVALEIGRKYVAYGIIFREGIPWFYVCEEETDTYPIPHFAGFFKIVDSSLSSYWKLHWSPEINQPSLLPKEWSDDDFFYENLVNGNSIEKKMFQVIKTAFDVKVHDVGRNE